MTIKGRITKIRIGDAEFTCPPGADLQTGSLLDQLAELQHEFAIAKRELDWQNRVIRVLARRFHGSIPLAELEAADAAPCLYQVDAERLEIEP